MAGKKDIVEQALKFIAQHFDEGAVRSAAQPVYKSRERLTYMSPDQFLQLARPIEGGPSQSKLDALRQSLDSGEKIRNMPFLNFTHEGDAARVTGHEGRHRALALKERGVEQMPVVMRSDRIRWSEQADPGRYDYIQDWPSVLRSETGEQSIPFPIERPKEANGGVVREGYQTKGRVVGDIVDQALKLIAGGAKEAGPSVAERAAKNIDVFNTANRLGVDTNDIAKLQETKRLMDYHKGFMGDVQERAKSLNKMVQQMKASGAFPMEIGTRYTTEHSRRTGQAPWTVTNYYVDPKNPQGSYGYYVRRELPEGGYEESISKIRDPNLEALHGPEKWEELQRGFVPMTGPKVVKASGGSIREGYGPGGWVDDVVKMAGKVISGEGEDAAKAGIRAYHGTPQPTENLIDLFHGTTPEAFDAITSSGNIFGSSRFSPRRDVAETFAYNVGGDDNTVVKVKAPASSLMIDLDLPNAKLLTPDQAAAYLDKPDWTILDFIENGYSVGVPDTSVLSIDRAAGGRTGFYGNNSISGALNVARGLNGGE